MSVRATLSPERRLITAGPLLRKPSSATTVSPTLPEGEAVTASKSARAPLAVNSKLRSLSPGSRSVFSACLASRGSRLEFVTGTAADALTSFSFLPVAGLSSGASLLGAGSGTTPYRSRSW